MLETIAELGLELETIFNKGAVMVLPSGVNKATGLTAALAGMGLSPHNVVGIGRRRERSRLSAQLRLQRRRGQRLPAVKETADLVTGGIRGAGVEELILALVDDDLATLPWSKERIVVGKEQDGSIIGITQERSSSSEQRRSPGRRFRR